MNENEFYVKNLGRFIFVVSLLSLDYTQTFVARNLDGECELYIFDEIQNDNDSVKWIASRITIDELGELNKGTRTLNSCFYGPRRTKKEGYLVVSKSGQDSADSYYLEDLSKYVATTDVYVPQFIDDKHGSSVLSLATGKALCSLVINEDEYADPFFDLNTFTSNLTKGKTFIESLHFGIEIKNNKACIQTNQSVIINFQISDKEVKKKNKNQVDLVDISENQNESKEAIKAIEKAFTSYDNKEQLISALGNDKKTITKFNNFISSISKNKKYEQSIQFVEPVSHKITSLKINSELMKAVSKNAKESIKTMNDSTKKTQTVNVTGHFELFEMNGTKKFRFIDNNKTIYRGIISNDYDHGKYPVVMQAPHQSYYVEFLSTYYDINNKATDFSYELLLAKKI